MRIIKEANTNIALLWRKPKILQTIYRPMKFLIKEKVEDGLLLYNIVTTEMVLLDNNESAIFEQLPGTYSQEMDDLISRHYIVSQSFDENKSVRELRALLKKINPSTRVNGFTILPTTECNARCYYCFESDFKRCTMSRSIANDVVDYIIKKSKGESVSLSWFGGEPLVANQRISQICEGLKKSSINYKSSMVSNAYLFDKSLIQQAKDLWNLRSVQITLDGTEDVYNKVKAYVNPKDNPYIRVINNINDLLENEIAVNVRLNVTNDNISNLYSLIDELAGQFGGKKGFSCYSHAVYEDVGFKPISYEDSVREMLDKKILELDSELETRKILGSSIRLPYLRILHCMADNDSCMLIYPDGTIGKCENKSSLDAIGDIYNDITNEDMDNQYKLSTHLSECSDCWLYPNCINLKLCPETGKCSKEKLDWKKMKYVALMKDKYLKYRLDEIETENDSIFEGKCDS